jgi:hypothetical protein
LIQKQKKRNHNLSAASQNETKQKVLPGKTGNKTKQAKLNLVHLAEILTDQTHAIIRPLKTK